MTIKKAYQKAAELLQKDFILNPSLEAKILIMQVLKINEKEFILNKDNRQIGLFKFLKLNWLIKRRLKGESIAGIICRKHFYDLDFYVNRNVLIPRPETELIIDLIIKKFKNSENLIILDIGTGSGNISITLADKLKNCISVIDALDISKKALHAAGKNIKRNKIDKNKVKLIYSDFFKYSTEKNYDIIITNPPYIKSRTVNELFVKKVVSDPRIALDGGEDGLKFYHRLLEFSKTNLKDNGYIIMEHGFDQREKILNIFKDSNYECSVYDDLAGINRVILVNKKG